LGRGPNAPLPPPGPPPPPSYFLPTESDTES
jgi:hypothetical protein